MAKRTMALYRPHKRESGCRVWFHVSDVTSHEQAYDVAERHGKGEYVVLSVVPSVVNGHNIEEVGRVFID
jgi:hypothetical protein